MSTLEIKGSILELLGNVHDKDLLVKIKNVLQKAAGKQTDSTVQPEWLSEEQLAELEKALDEIMDDANLIPHEEAMKKFRTWSK